MATVVHYTVHAAPEADAVWGRDLFPAHHTISQSVGMAVCAGSHGSVLQQQHGGHRTHSSHTHTLHYLLLLDCCKFILVFSLAK